MSKRRIFEGVVDVCAHRVSFWFELRRLKQTPELETELTEHAEERAKTCIIDGYRSGELNCYHVTESGREHEVRGWWDINPDA